MRYADYTPLDTSHFSAEQLNPVGASLEPHSPEAWRDLAEQNYLVLSQAPALKGITAETLANLSVALVYQMAHTFGGSALYIPQGKHLARDDQNERIVREFQGNNITALARKYRLTEMRVRQILKKHNTAQRQSRTPATGPEANH